MGFLRFVHSRKLLLLFIISIVSLMILLISISNSSEDPVDRKRTLDKINEFIESQRKSGSCKQPKLPTFAPEIMKFVHHVDPIVCTKAGIDWVKCTESVCAIQEAAVNEFGPIRCSFTDLIRVNDFDSLDGQTTFSDQFYKLEASDVVRVSCKSETRKWSATLTGIRINNTIWEKCSWSHLPANAIKLNVLMFGLDSMSRNSFIRKLPKTYRYMKEVLKTDILEGYNIVGDGTPQALIPILTGKTELELPDTRKRFPNTKYVDVYPFIWNNFRNAGYVTAFFEDVPELSTFTYRLNGFKEAPTDHYMRPYYLAALSERRKWPKLCTGEVPRHQVMLNQIKNFFNVYKTKPKFLFGFHGELSHDDYNLVGVADDDLYQFLKYLKTSKILDNTLLIFMADHGHRFAEIRNTLQGKQEERLPFFSFTFPHNFKVHFKTAYKNFVSNLDKLSTPFDIYTTLKNIVNVDDFGTADIDQRAVSLLKKIPEERNCGHAYIEPHWCACLEWTNIPVVSPISRLIAEALLRTINEYTEPHRDICEILSIADVKWVMKMAPNDNLVKYKKNSDRDGFVGDFSATMNFDVDTYQVKVVLTPGMSIFEASVFYHLKGDYFNVNISDISRINMYGRQARCVEIDFPHLRKYCYCKD